MDKGVVVASDDSKKHRGPRAVRQKPSENKRSMVSNIVALFKRIFMLESKQGVFIRQRMDSGPLFHRKSASRTVISPDAYVRGEIVGKGDIVIEGCFEGNIDLARHRVLVEASGSVVGNIRAKCIYISGKAKGEFIGKKTIVISDSSVVDGTVKAERVKLRPGADFTGSIEMD